MTTALSKSSSTTDSEVADSEVTDSEVADSGDTSSAATEPGRRISISVRGLAVGSIAVALIAALGVMTWLYLGARTKLDDQARQVADGTHAEQVALDYAVNAAIMDFKDLGPWKQNLVKNTTPELADKLTKAATAMEQIILPLQWTSTAQPLAAKVRSQADGSYVVDAFVGVMTKTVQSADSLQSTATYSITVDGKDSWQITDVGGIASVVTPK